MPVGSPRSRVWTCWSTPCRSLRATIVGDGPDRIAIAIERAAAHSTIELELLGHQTRAQFERLIRWADLLVIPSRRPEPFGLVGCEAAAVGLPAVGFAGGGIPEWLDSGIEGELAAADADRGEAHRWDCRGAGGPGSASPAPRRRLADGERSLGAGSRRAARNGASTKRRRLDDRRHEYDRVRPPIHPPPPPCSSVEYCWYAPPVAPTATRARHPYECEASMRWRTCGADH